MLASMSSAPQIQPELPEQVSSHNLELRLLPYWKGVKQYRSTTAHQRLTPQEYCWRILASDKHPTVASGRIIGFHTRADMYFARLPAPITAKLWRNFGAQPQAPGVDRYGYDRYGRPHF